MVVSCSGQCLQICIHNSIYISSNPLSTGESSALNQHASIFEFGFKKKVFLLFVFVLSSIAVHSLLIKFRKLHLTSL